MNFVSGAPDISSQPVVTHPGTVVPRSGLETESSTLAILPLRAKHEPSVVDWLKARQRLGQLAKLAPGWNGAQGKPPDPHTISFAARQLAELERLGMPAPLLNPAGDGSLYAEWHMRGLDIEIIFEAPYKVIVLVEDARGMVPSYEEEGTDVNIALKALQELCAR